jgi:hypothetical protein
MKTIVLFSANNQFRVELKCDIFDNSEAFTIMDIVNRSADEVKAGVGLKELPNSIEGLKTYATNLNVNMDIIDIDPAVATINAVTGATALSMTSTGAQAAGATGTAYHEQIVVAGGNAPFTFSVTSGALPSGLYLDANSGYISGTPDTVENPTFGITVTDAFGQSDVDATLSINIV